MVQRSVVLDAIGNKVAASFADYAKDTITMISYQWCSSKMPFFFNISVFPFPPHPFACYLCMITVYYGSSSEAACLDIKVGPSFANKIRN